MKTSFQSNPFEDANKSVNGLGDYGGSLGQGIEGLIYSSNFEKLLKAKQFVSYACVCYQRY